MTLRRQWGIVAAVILFLAGALGAATHALKDELFPVAVGSSAPSMKGTALDGSRRAKVLADYKDKVVLLNLWATWCEPCRVEMPSMERLHQEFASQGLAVVAISEDDAGARGRVLEYAKELGLTFEVLHDPEQLTRHSYQVTGYPTTFVIARALIRSLLQ
jgi:cytochrome c biogenesis protein CcmG/thiol:disulfide interchange protein DsbE